MQKPKPYLLNITLYSLLVVFLIMLVVNTYFISNKSEMDSLYSFFYFDNYKIFAKGAIYISFFLLLLSIYSIIQMHRRKIHGVYIFFLSSLIVIIYLIFSEPIEFVNIFMLITINYILFMHRSWFKSIDIHLADNLSDTVDKAD